MLALLAGVVAYSTAAADRLPQLVGGLGAAGVALAALALAVRWPSVLPWSVAGVGASYAVYVALRPGSVDARAPLVAAALFAATELGFWALEPRAAGAAREVVVRRIAAVGLGTLAAALLGSLLLVVTSEASGGLVLEALGVAAALATVGAIALFAAHVRRAD